MWAELRVSGSAFALRREDTMECDDFADLQSTWEDLAKQDPLWAILSVPAKKGGKWNLEEFFHVLGVKS